MNRRLLARVSISRVELFHTTEHPLQLEGRGIVRACTYILYNIVNQMYMHCCIDTKSISISTRKPPRRHATMAQSCFTATCQNCFNIPECVRAYVQRKIFVFRGTTTISSNNNGTTIYKVIASLTPER